MPPCLTVTVGGPVADENDPYVRAYLCAPALPSLTHSCNTSPSVCGIDAPICTTALPDGGQDCVSHCTDDLGDPGLRCPSGTSCADLDGGAYCLVAGG